MNAIQTDENRFLNSLTVFEKVASTISKCFSLTRVCAWGDIVPLNIYINKSDTVPWQFYRHFHSQRCLLLWKQLTAQCCQQTNKQTNKQKSVRILVVYDQLTGLAGYQQVVKNGKYTWTEQFSMKCWKAIHIFFSFVLLCSVIGLKTFTPLSRPIRGPTKFSRSFENWLGEQGWRSGESTSLPPICSPGSIPGVICGLSLLLVLILAPRGFSAGTPVFPSPQKPTFPNSNSTRNLRATGLSVITDC